MKSLQALVITLAMVAPAAIAQTHVNGYYRSNGTYVQPHVRSSPDSSRFNNWSTQGNVNPYTGSAGTQNPYRSYGSTNSFGSSNGGFKPYQPSSNPYRWK